MIAYHGNPGIKQKYLLRVAAHREADNLIQGTGWENGKGCAVGCTLEAYQHKLYPIELGIPVNLAYLEDAIFDGLPPNLAMEWPERFLSAIRPGADLALVRLRFVVWLLSEDLVAYRTPAIDSVVALCRRLIAGDEPKKREWYAAITAAEATTIDDAHTAACAAIAAASSRVEDAASDSAAIHAHTAAYIHARAEAEAAAARNAAYQRQADKLIQLLVEATPPSR